MTEAEYMQVIHKVNQLARTGVAKLSFKIPIFIPNYYC